MQDEAGTALTPSDPIDSRPASATARGRSGLYAVLGLFALVTLVVKTVLELHYGAEIAAGRKH